MATPSAFTAQRMSRCAPEAHPIGTRKIAPGRALFAGVAGRVRAARRGSRMCGSMAYSLGDSAVEAIASNDLTSPVGSALASTDAVVTDWRVEVLKGGAGFIGSVYRFAGTAEDRGARVPWSLVLKAIRGDPSESSTDVGYWKREIAAYQSGALDALPAGVRAPRCHGCVVTDEGAWLWLEDVRDDL